MQVGMHEKKTVEQWLNDVDYDFIGYVPSDEALFFTNFIKEVNAGAEENETPIVHLVMMDNIFNKDRRCALLCYRGSGKTSVFAEYLILFIAAFGYLPGFGKIQVALYVTDSIENGVKNLRRNIEYRYQESSYLQELIPNKRITVISDSKQEYSLNEYDSSSNAGIKFTDIRLEFINHKGHRFILKGYGARSLSLDTRLYTPTGYTSIGECKIGDYIYDPDGDLVPITNKSVIFHKPTYKLELDDGRCLKVSIDHINSVLINTQPNGVAKWEEKNLTTKELLQIGYTHTKIGNKKHKGVSTKCTIKIKNTKPLQYLPYDFTIDPYTLGLILGDGSIKKNTSGIVITGLIEDCKKYKKLIPYKVGSNYIDKRNCRVVTFAIKEINQQIRDLDLAVHGSNKFIPEIYYFGSVQQRVDLLRGLLDTDGSITKNGRITFSSTSEQLAKDVVRLVRSLGGKSKLNIKKTDRDNVLYRPEIWININPFKLKRKSERFIQNRIHWDSVNICSITQINIEPTQCIAVGSQSHQFLAGEYFRTHNTGVRGAKELAKRPTLAIFDDLLSDQDANSAAIIKSVEDTVYKAVSKALHPTNQKMIWAGTPFNAKDPFYKAVESGAWKVSVFPVCATFPCTKEEFRGAWEDRFPYEYVLQEYNEALALGNIENFNQELMLRIMSEDDRLIQDSEIGWYNRDTLLANLRNFTLYITTDFATKEEQKNDYSVISVWAYNHKGYWFWVDGICEKQDMSKNIKDLFRLVSKYDSKSTIHGVGIEVSGQQQGFVSWIQEKMIDTNNFFPITTYRNGGKPGINPGNLTNKLVKFQVMVPRFKAHEMFFPTQLKYSKPMLECMGEISLVSNGGIKSKNDDFIDTISMLAYMQPIKPSVPLEMKKSKIDYWDFEEDDEDDADTGINSYIV